jgi:AcrR family transcriptional regulator
MNDIAKRSHKAKGSLYYNFKGKMDIFKALVEQEYADIKAKLIESCQFTEEPPITKDKVVKYLQIRMELIGKAPMIRQTIMAQYYETGHEIITVVEDIRKDFDQWEWQLFYDICNTGKKYEVLTSDIQPNAFADMLQMLLKALEILFFAKDEYEKSKSTYESMILFLLNK